MKTFNKNSLLEIDFIILIFFNSDTINVYFYFYNSLKNTTLTTQKQVFNYINWRSLANLMSSEEFWQPVLSKILRL